MNDLIILGGGGHARVIISLIKKIKDFHILGYTAPEDSGNILGVIYLGPDEVLSNILKENTLCSAVIGIGLTSQKDISKRKTLQMRLEKSGFKFPLIVSPTAVINEEVQIGKATVICDSVTLNSGTKIGKTVIINTNASVDHDCQIGDNVHIAPGVTLGGGVSIGSESLIGIGSIVIHNIQIGTRCFIAAGSVVTKNCTNSGTYAGIPARLIKRL